VKLSVGRISHWRTSDPKVSSAKAVAEYFQCSIDDLMKGEYHG